MIMLLAAGEGCVDERHLQEDDPSVAGLVVQTLPCILRGCELARRLEAELPRISSQTQLVLLNCQQIAAVFREAATSLMSTDHGNGSTTSTPQHHHQHSSPTSSPSEQQQYLNAPASNQQLQHNPPPTTPQCEQQQQGFSHILPHHNYLYAAPGSPASPGTALLGVDEFLADVDLDFLSSGEFNLGSVCSPEGGCDAACTYRQSSSGSVDLRSAIAVTTGGVTGQGRTLVDHTGRATSSILIPVAVCVPDAVVEASGAPDAAPIEEAKAAEEVDGDNTGKPRPTAEASNRQRLSKKRKDAGDCAQMRTIRLPAPRTGDLEAPPEDGYAWRKYGHKDILHARFPRCYYRCIHKSSCDAKKQVQRLDHDPFTYEITYYGNHSCRSPQEDTTAAATAGGQQRTMFISQSSSTSDLQAHPRETQTRDSSPPPANKKARWPSHS